MKILDNLINLFKYEEKSEYDFILDSNSEQERNLSYDDENKNLQIKQDVFFNIDDNLNFLKIKYNSLINSDIIFRELSILVKDVEYKAFIVFIDGLVNSTNINDFILKPLMMRNQSNTFVNNKDKENNSELSTTPTSTIVDNNHTIKPTENEKKIITKNNKQFILKIKPKDDNINNENNNNSDLTDYIMYHLMPQNDVKIKNKFSEIIASINSGNCILFVDSLNYAFDLEVKGFKERSVNNPQNEIVIKGPQEAFVENIRTNTSLIRRSVNNENLIIENITIGKLTNTRCAICYLENIVNSSLVAEIKYRLNNLELDSLLSSGQLEQLIEDTNYFGIPKILSTERPDKCTKALYDGRVVVIVNGNPYALIMPTTFIDFISSPEDTNLRPQFANFLKFFRFLAMFITLLLPSFWISITNFHQELIPTDFLFSIVSARENVPFPVIFEIIVMEFSFELIREASLRVPSPVGSTIGIVGALVLGEAAVSANIVSPLLIIVIALTGIASFAIPDFSFGFHVRVMRFIFIIFGYIAGFLGIGIALFSYVCILCSLKSFGVPYMAPFAPLMKSRGTRYFVHVAYKQEQRPDYLNTKRPVAQEHISMKWKKF